MLLTLHQPSRLVSEFRYPHEYPVPRSYPPSARPPIQATCGPGPPSQLLPASVPATMSSSHRGLPPPAAMTLPDPSRAAPLPLSISQPLTQMPAPPPQWQGAEDSMRSWLSAKAEEDRWRQEEEKTRQESLRLEQRKIEQAMLRESMQGGVPPHLVPIIFASIGGGNSASMAVDCLQQHAAQLQAQPPQDARRADPRPVNPVHLPSVYAGMQQTAPAPPAQVPAQPPAVLFPSMSPRARTAANYPQPPKPPAHSQLPRLTTIEMQGQAPPQAQPLSTIQELHQQEAQASSPSIYFHHWVPPNTQSSSGTNPSVAASDYASSPRKRKSHGPHQAAPPPSSTPQQINWPLISQHPGPSSSTPGHRRHARTRSDQSSRGLATTEQTPYTGRSRAGTHTGAESSTHSERHVSHDPPQRDQQQRQQHHRPPLHGPVERGSRGNDSEGSERSWLAQHETRPLVQASQASRPSTPKQREAEPGCP